MIIKTNDAHTLNEIHQNLISILEAFNYYKDSIDDFNYNESLNNLSGCQETLSEIIDNLKPERKFKVSRTGRDCDGFGSDKTYEFDTIQEAKDFADNCNEGSDGLIYTLTY